MSQRKNTSRTILGLLLSIALLAASALAGAEEKRNLATEDTQGTESLLRAPAQATPVGAWFGIARPCIPPPAGGVPVGAVDLWPDPAICKQSGTNEPNLFPNLEVTMIPTILGDGTVLADDFGELFDGHTTAQGKWEFAGQVNLDGDGILYDKYQATFIWFSHPILPGAPANPGFIGVIRPRFVMFFDPNHPDQARGFIQPYLYQFTKADPSGIGLVTNPPSPVSPFFSPFPDPNPTDPLPATCVPSGLFKGDKVPCLGTLHFYIRKIPAR
jgi:hypothetical protein